ncbi:hypothetical protein NECAME_18748 [Necator americanus]|uniref:Uncharacterized protein n=1 Tax=Necator americanus TaxID=51031 RepID=W2SVA8_NECAM|nr:hypothetical protein NECAME_18748 [Necator americanus]ETN72637.1 hypothetical protein NECAME_18748 [Necator americanus]
MISWDSIGEFRPSDPNETVNEVASNWGAAQAMAQARGEDVKYFATPGQNAGKKEELIHQSNHELVP